MKKTKPATTQIGDTMKNSHPGRKIEVNLTELNQIEVPPPRGSGWRGCLPRSRRCGSHFHLRVGMFRVGTVSRAEFAQICDTQVVDFGNFWPFFERFAMKKFLTLFASE